MIKPQTAGLVVGISIAVVLWYMHDTLLLVFGGVLIALVLRGIAERLSRISRLSVIFCVWITVFTLFVAAVVTMALMGNAAAVQIAELRSSLPTAFHDMLQQMRSTPLGVWIVGNVPDVSAIVPDGAHLWVRATGVLSGTVGALTGMLIIGFVGVAGALEPQIYVSGFVKILPVKYRPRIRIVMSEVAQTLQTWLLARLISMFATGILVAIGLTLLRIPLAMALGVLAGALAFIPNIGAIVAGAPALVLAFAISPRLALAVLVMYWGVHFLDDFVLAPIIERRVAKLPPILTLVAQVVLGMGAGVVGIMLAGPLVAALIVLVRRLWIEDVADRSGREAEQMSIARPV